MFEYKTRTETINGCRFYEQDILMFDNSYSGDFEVHCKLDYNAPGFGIVIAEDTADISKSENVYIVELGARNEYQVIHKELTQRLMRSGFIQPGKDINVPTKDLELCFRFTEGYKVDVLSDDILLISFGMVNEMPKFKIGFYSNVGNIINWAVVYSETPSNWISNIWNGQGGSIIWIENGFKLEDCLYPCEVECQNNLLPAGTYYLDFKAEDTENLEYFVYPTSKKVSFTKEERGPFRYMDEDASVLVGGNKIPFKEALSIADDMSEHKWIMDTRWDHENNILDYDTMSFTLEEPTAINIKFKATKGKITEIAIKKYKSDSFVSTKYHETSKPASYIMIDLDKIKKVEITAVIKNLPSEDTLKKGHRVAESGELVYRIDDFDVKLDESYVYNIDAETRNITVNGNEYAISDNENKLYMFKNMDAIITGLVIINSEGERLDVLLQKTFKVNVPKTINSPIIVTSDDGIVYDLSSEIREIADEAHTVDIFNRYNEMHLRKSIVMNSTPKVVGVIDGIIDTSTDYIEVEDGKYFLIEQDKYTVDYKNNVVKLHFSVKEQYKYILVEYQHCDDYSYEFTNYARELVNLDETENIYLKAEVCNAINAITIYGIPETAVFRPELLYRVKDSRAINTIDYCTDIYDELPGALYSVSQAKRLIIDNDTRKKYKYLVIEYLKDRSYAVNEKDDVYEVDIAASDDNIRLWYDSDENGVTHTYSATSIGTSDLAVTDNFIVLNKEVRV